MYPVQNFTVKHKHVDEVSYTRWMIPQPERLLVLCNAITIQGVVLVFRETSKYISTFPRLFLGLADLTMVKQLFSSQWNCSIEFYCTGRIVQILTLFNFPVSKECNGAFVFSLRDLEMNRSPFMKEVTNMERILCF